MTRIEGFLRTLSPVHQTRPGVEGFLDHTASGRPIVSFVKKRKGPVQVQMVSPVFDETCTRGEVPIVTGNSGRGVLRRKATRHLLKAINQPIRTELFQCLSVGSAHRKDMGGAKTAAMLAVAVDNIFAGLFGGGGASLTSHYTLADMFPITDQTAHLVPTWVKDAAGVIGRRESRETGEAYDQRLTHIFATIKRDPLLDGEGKDFVVDHDAAYMAAQAAGLKATKAKKSAEEQEPDGDEAQGGLRNMTYVEAMVPGLALNFSLQFRPQMKDYHIGLMLLALQDWVNEQKLGGASRRGFGRFQPNLKLLDESGSEPVSIDVFLPVEENGSVAGYRINPALSHYIEAADAELRKQSIAVLEDLYVSNKAA